MPKNGNKIQWTAARRAAHAEATIAGRKRKRRVTPRALKHFSESGIVAEELRPIVKLRTMQYSRMLDDLGGEVSMMQRGVADAWLYSMICADAQFSRLLENPRADRLPERLCTCLNSARAALSLLGLERRARETESVTLEALVAAEPPDDEQSNSSPGGDDDRATQTNVGRSSIFARARAAGEHDDSSPIHTRGESS